MDTKTDEIIFLNLDKAFKICELCRKHDLNKRNLWNKKQILEKIEQEKNVYLFSENQIETLNYHSYSCALSHYKKECMKDCIINQDNLTNKIGQYKFWSYCSYPKE